MDWHRIKSEKDIEELMEIFNGFRQCVLTEMDYVSGAFVHHALLMYPVNAKRRLRMIFQQQDKDVPAIELSFQDTSRLNLVPVRTNRTAEIEGVYFAFHQGRLYWADSPNFDVADIDKESYINQISWLEAKQAQWRIIPGHLGNEPVYTPEK